MRFGIQYRIIVDFHTENNIQSRPFDAIKSINCCKTVISYWYHIWETGFSAHIFITFNVRTLNRIHICSLEPKKIRTWSDTKLYASQWPASWTILGTLIFRLWSISTGHILMNTFLLKLVLVRYWWIINMNSKLKIFRDDVAHELKIDDLAENIPLVNNQRPESMLGIEAWSKHIT